MNCGQCHWWISFRDFYEDKLEDSDCGFCHETGTAYGLIIKADQEECSKFKEEVSE